MTRLGTCKGKKVISKLVKAEALPAKILRTEYCFTAFSYASIKARSSQISSFVSLEPFKMQ